MYFLSLGVKGVILHRFDDFLLEALATRDSPIRATPTPERKRRMSDLSTFTKVTNLLGEEVGAAASGLEGSDQSKGGGNHGN